MVLIFGFVVISVVGYSGVLMRWSFTGWRTQIYRKVRHMDMELLQGNPTQSGVQA